MWHVQWKDPAGVKHYREVWSPTEGRSLLRKQTEAGGVPIDEPVELDDRWGVRWRDARGRGHKRVVGTYGAAKDLLLEEDGKRKRGEFADPKDGRKKLAEVYELQSTSKSYADATAELRALAWTKYIAPKLADTQIAKIDPTAIEAVLASVEAPEMRAKVRALLGVLFGYAVEQGWLTTSPVRKPRRDGTRAARIERGTVQAKDRRRYLDEEQLARLLRELPERWRTMVELMARMGLRPGEAVALTITKFSPPTDVPERKPATIRIDTALSGFTKTGEPRTLTLPTIVAERLTEHLRRVYGQGPCHDEDPVFPKADGSPISTKNSASAWRRRIFTPAATRAGLGEGFTPNMLRHSAASFAIAHGADVYSVQRMLGHRTASITLDVYGALWDSSAELLAERLDEAIRQAAAPAPATTLEMAR
jgi:integrase